MSFSIRSIGCPVAAEKIRLMRSRILMISRASMSMSAAVPPLPPAGWWSRKRVLGRQKRSSRGTDTKISAPALATHPVPTILTRGLMKRITSWMVSPDSTWPPCELMKRVIGLSESAASASSCAITCEASAWLISPLMTRVRALNSRSLSESVTVVGVDALTCGSCSCSCSWS